MFWQEKKCIPPKVLYFQGDSWKILAKYRLLITNITVPSCGRDNSGPNSGWGQKRIYPHTVTVCSWVYSIPSGRAFHWGIAHRGKNVPSCQGKDKNMFYWVTFIMAQTPTLTTWHAYLQKRRILSTSSLSLKLQVLLDPQMCRSSRCSTSIPVAVPTACKVGVDGILADAWYTEVQLRKSIHIDYCSAQHWQICMKTKTQGSSQWTKVREVWLVITHNPWP